MVSIRLDEEAIFKIAAGIPDEATRNAYLQQVCGDDDDLLERVSNLLHAFVGAPSFLESPPPGLAATFITAPPPQASGSKIGPYKIREQLGEGGMGIVYVAEQTEPVRRKVALKIIKPGMDSKEVIARFEAERQALAMMAHPNIAKVLDGGTTETGLPYFVMELVEGVPITRFCDEQKLSMRKRLELFVTVCQAVQHAHIKGIIHRDLKPSNVLVELHDVTPVPKVIDFGIAKATNQQLTQQTIYTQFSQLVGTPLYMSPEQAQLSGLDIDTRSDVYSLGVMLYELLAGTTPFDESRLSSVGLDEMRRIIREDDPPRPSYKVSTLDQDQISTISVKRQTDPRQLSLVMRRELDWIVMKALEKDRTRRYESASDLAEDIQRYLHDEPVKACPPSVSYKLMKYMKRHKGLLTTLALMAATLLIATGVSVSYAIQAEKSAEDARIARDDAEEKKEDAVEARNLADKRLKQSRVDFDRALKSMDAIVEEVSSAEFAQLPGVEKVRNDILDKMLGFYAEIIADHDNDPYARMQRAIAHQHIAWLRGSSNQTTQQLNELNTSVSILEALIEEHPDDFDYESSLGRALFARMHAAASPIKQQLADAERLVTIDRKGVALGRPESVNRLPLSFLKVADRLPPDSPRVRELIDASFQFSEEHNLTPHPGAFTWEARLAVNAEELEQAVIYYDHSVEGFQKIASDPRNRLGFIEHWLTTLILREQAAVYQRLEDLENTESAFKEAYAIARELYLAYHADPRVEDGFVFATLDLTEFLESQGRIDEAAEIWRNSLASGSAPTSFARNYADFLVRTAENPVPDLTSAIQSFPTESYYYLVRGVIFRKQGEFERALADLDRAIELTPGDPVLFKERAELFGHKKEFDKAEADYAEWVSLSKGTADAYFTRGNFYLKTVRDYDKALADFNQSLDLFSNHGYRFKRRALTHFYLEQYQEALADLETCYELSPDDESAVWWIPAHLVAACPDEEFRKAMREFADRVVQNAPDSIDALIVRVPLLIEFQDWEAAQRDLTRIVSAAKAEIYQLYRAGLVSLKTENPAQYRTHCQTMVSRFANSEIPRETHFSSWTCALASNALDDYEPAIKLARHAVEQDPDNQQYLNGLGAILLRAGKYDDAKKQLKKALEAGSTEQTSASYTHYFLAMTEHALGNQEAADREFTTANQLAETELAGSPVWNRKLTLELLRKEAASRIGKPAEDDDSNISPPPMPR